MAIKFKFDKARKQIKVEGIDKPIKAQTLEYFVQQNTFDKDKSIFLNYKGLTFVIENPPGDEDEEIFFPINLQYQDTPEQDRLLKMKSNADIDAIYAIKEEYGCNN